MFKIDMFHRKGLKVLMYADVYSKIYIKVKSLKGCSNQYLGIQYFMEAKNAKVIYDFIFASNLFSLLVNVQCQQLLF